MSKTNSDIPEKTNGRWWEFYLVRYLLGSIVGAALLIILNNQSTGKIKGLFSICPIEISLIDAHTILLWAGLGFAYCYLASAPILVLHATRGAAAITMSKLTCCVVIITAIFVSCIQIIFWPIYITLVTYILLVQVFFIYFGLKKDSDNSNAICNFYKELITERTELTPARSLYIESYKHLREHGNAFFIVLLEFVFAFSLWYAETLEQLYILVFLWISPAAFVWVVGTCLESKIHNFPKP
ncbi:MAG: hypothetical protein ABL919_12120 [Methylococcales bacterium]|nr:hypothetical protein [Methylococcaceae bacterium]